MPRPGLRREGGRLPGELTAPAPPPTPARRRLRRAALPLVLWAALMMAAIAGYRASLRGDRPIPGLRLSGVPVGGLAGDALRTAVTRATSRHLRGDLLLDAGGWTLRVRRREAGVRVLPKDTVRRIRRAGRSGDPWADISLRWRALGGQLDLSPAATLDPTRGLALLRRLAALVDRPALPPRLDLDAGRVIPARPGRTLRLAASLASLARAVSRGSARARLAVETLPAPDAHRYRGLDVSHVLASFTTVYSLADKDRDRAHNLKVGASHLDGVVIAPGATFSYNEAVGPRDRGGGYRVAPIISQGELVDGMAGGACQLSSTLFAAAFFAGLDLVRSRPHTMPSGYIKMGLDAAVAYPGVDLVLRNPYPFPVAIRFRVGGGRVTATIRGRARPHRRVVFRRELLETTPFPEVRRDDPTLPRGVEVERQRGVPGHRFRRSRLFFAGGPGPARVETRVVRYPPVTRIVRVGTGPPDPSWRPPPGRPPFPEPDPELVIAR